MRRLQMYCDYTFKEKSIVSDLLFFFLLQPYKMQLIRGFLFFVIFAFFEASTEAEEGDQNRFLYPGEAKSERDLEQCGKHEVCSIVHKRFYYPKIVERFCRCADAECQSTWTETQDNYTMHVNNRAQMKFCEPVINLPSCVDTNETTPRYLTVTNTTFIVHPDTQDEESLSDYKITSTAACYCPPHHTWKCSLLQSNSSSDIQVSVMHFRCAPLPKCNVGDFCGSERTDYYSTYYHCSCPTGHLCIRNHTNSQFPIKEIFYDGAAYKAQCTRFPEA